jgi:hypothetical protein
MNLSGSVHSRGQRLWLQAAFADCPGAADYLSASNYAGFRPFEAAVSWFTAAAARATSNELAVCLWETKN